MDTEGRAACEEVMGVNLSILDQEDYAATEACQRGYDSGARSLVGGVGSPSSATGTRPGMPRFLFNGTIDRQPSEGEHVPTRRLERGMPPRDDDLTTIVRHKEGHLVIQQDILPFPPTPSASIAGRTMQESSYGQRVTPRRLPEGAPNILLVLIDDAGPGLPDTFGGEVRTNTLSRIHREGIGFNRFHTTAMCSPTRASLLTGRNHHRIGNGQIAELANDWDGYAGEIPKSSALAAEVLKQYGYATAAFGKWHNTPAIETTTAGP